MSHILRGVAVLVLSNLWTGTRDGTITSVIPAPPNSDAEPRANVMVFLDPSDEALRREHGNVMPLEDVDVAPPGTPEVSPTNPATPEGQEPPASYPPLFLLIAKSTDLSSPQGVQQSIDAVRQQAQAVADNLATAASTLGNHGSQLSTLSTQLSALQSRVNDLASQQSIVAADVAQLAATVNALSSRVPPADIPATPPG